MKPTDILFKAKRKDNGEWVEGAILPSERDNLILEVTGYYNDTPKICPIVIDVNTISMWTTLTDKNGKKVFTGDIIEIHSRGFDFTCIVRNNLRLEPCNAKSKEWEHMLYSPFWKECEIIGSIHDNPELIEETK